LLDRTGVVDARLDDLGAPLEPFIKSVGDAASNVRLR
jgi:hypothetical protein